MRFHFDADGTTISGLTVVVTDDTPLDVCDVPEHLRPFLTRRGTTTADLENTYTSFLYPHGSLRIHRRHLTSLSIHQTIERATFAAIAVEDIEPLHAMLTDVTATVRQYAYVPAIDIVHSIFLKGRFDGERIQLHRLQSTGDSLVRYTAIANSATPILRRLEVLSTTACDTIVGSYGPRHHRAASIRSAIA